MLLNLIAPISIMFTPRHLFESDKSSLLGTGTACSLYHSSKSTFPSQKSVMKLKWWRRFVASMALKAFRGTQLRPNTLLFLSYVTACMDYFQFGALSNFFITYRSLMSLMIVSLVGL